jgi:hypothetical protein
MRTSNSSGAPRLPASYHSRQQTFVSVSLGTRAALARLLSRFLISDCPMASTGRESRLTSAVVNRWPQIAFQAIGWIWLLLR